MKRLQWRGWPDPDHALDWYEDWQQRQQMDVSSETLDGVLFPMKRDGHG